MGRPPADHHYCAHLVRWHCDLSRDLGRPIPLGDTIAMNLILLIGGIIGSYVFGAVWEKNTKIKTDIAQQAVERSEANTTVKVEPRPPLYSSYARLVCPSAQSLAYSPATKKCG